MPSSSSAAQVPTALDDGIDAADLVEVDLLGRAAVEVALDLGAG